MIRVWSEHLAFAEAMEPAVLDYLERSRFHPVFAVHPGADIDQLMELSGRVEARGLEMGIWPLLEEDAGYWPSVRNARSFVRRVRRLVDELQEGGARPSWLAFDMEPPLSGESLPDSIRRLAVRRWRGHRAGRFDAARREFGDLAAELEELGIGTLGVTTPPVSADESRETPLVAKYLETPWPSLEWDRAGVMAYGSIVAGHAGNLMNYRDVRALHYQLFLRTVRSWGDRAHASLGITGTGVYGDEPVYERPEELARDVAAARAAGIDDLAIFSLEGLLGRDDPREWADRIVEAEPEPPPPTVRAEATWAAAGIANRVAGWLG